MLGDLQGFAMCLDGSLSDLGVRAVAGGLGRGLMLWRSALRADCAAVLGQGAVPQNSLRSLRSLRLYG